VNGHARISSLSGRARLCQPARAVGPVLAGTCRWVGRRRTAAPTIAYAAAGRNVTRVTAASRCVSVWGHALGHRPVVLSGSAADIAGRVCAGEGSGAALPESVHTRLAARFLGSKTRCVETARRKMLRWWLAAACI